MLHSVEVAVRAPENLLSVFVRTKVRAVRAVKNYSFTAFSSGFSTENCASKHIQNGGEKIKYVCFQPKNACLGLKMSIISKEIQKKERDHCAKTTLRNCRFFREKRGWNRFVFYFPNHRSTLPNQISRRSAAETMPNSTASSNILPGQQPGTESISPNG